jgi:hypothetical protein
LGFLNYEKLKDFYDKSNKRFSNNYQNGGQGLKLLNEDDRILSGKIPGANKVK